MEIIWAKTALTPSGWKNDVRIAVADDGTIASVEADKPQEGTTTDILLAAPVNLHSHAFQRAMAGMSEMRGPVGPDGHDTFWTWRNLMFRFVDQMTPEDNAAIASYLMMEMLESGYAGLCEFHYVHHQPDGNPYDNIAEMALSIVQAADQTGMGLTLLPVLYEHGGCDGRPLTNGQARFGNDIDRYAELYAASREAIQGLPKDRNIGVAPHSLRAVSRQALSTAIEMAGDQPIHMHIAEQIAEIEEVEASWGKRPVDWLLSEHDVSEQWCLIHCTHMTEVETAGLAKSGAIAGLCPLTESSLGDGIFNGVQFLEEGGRFGVGSDSNIYISLSNELRTFEYSQRLRHQQRAVLATHEKSTGRRLYDEALIGGAQAGGRNSGAIEQGKLADLVALSQDQTDLYLKQDDMILDSFIFASDDRCVTDTWSAGRHMVREGKHIGRDQITRNYRKTMASLKERI